MRTGLFKSPGLFSVFLADLRNAVIWMVSVRIPVFSSTIPLTKPFRGSDQVYLSQLVSPVTFVFHSFF